jgi:hypothetical protein
VTDPCSVASPVQKVPGEFPGDSGTDPVIVRSTRDQGEWQSGSAYALPSVPGTILYISVGAEFWRPPGGLGRAIEMQKFARSRFENRSPDNGRAWYWRRTDCLEADGAVPCRCTEPDSKNGGSGRWNGSQQRWRDQEFVFGRCNSY